MKTKLGSKIVAFYHRQAVIAAVTAAAVRAGVERIESLARPAVDWLADAVGHMETSANVAMLMHVRPGDVLDFGNGVTFVTPTFREAQAGMNLRREKLRMGLYDALGIEEETPVWRDYDTSIDSATTAYLARRPKPETTTTPYGASNADVSGDALLD